MKPILFITVFSTLLVNFSFQKTSPSQRETLLTMDQTITTSSGVDLFLENPANYSFICTPTSKGDVISAYLSDNGKMVIHYASFWDDGDHSGKTEGFYNREKNHFQGNYETNDGRFSGEINFSFNEKGEAQGTWDNGYGIIKIPLKRQ